jgi:hypothetical protein
MRLSFVGITPDTPDSQCPAVFVDEDTGEIWFQGETVTDPVELAEVDLLLPGNDCWVFDNQRVQFNYFSGIGDFLATALSDEPVVVKQCAAAFEAVWEHAVPHGEYQLR